LILSAYDERIHVVVRCFDIQSLGETGHAVLICRSLVPECATMVEQPQPLSVLAYWESVVWSACATHR